MTLLHYSDPESKAELEARKRLRDLEWLKNQIGESTYVASLINYGYSEKDAQTELNLLKQHKQERQPIPWKDRNK